MASPESGLPDAARAVRDIRSTVFQLEPSASEGIRDSLHALIAEYTDVLGFAPELRISGPLDTPAPRSTDELLAVLRQVLSSIARQARATQASVVVGVESARSKSAERFRSATASSARPSWTGARRSRSELPGAG